MVNKDKNNRSVNAKQDKIQDSSTLREIFTYPFQPPFSFLSYNSSPSQPNNKASTPYYYL